MSNPPGIKAEKIPKGVYTPSSRFWGTDMPGGRVYINTKNHKTYAENYDKIKWRREEEDSGRDYGKLDNASSERT